MKNYITKQFFILLLTCLLTQNFKGQITTLYSEDFSTSSFTTNGWSFPSGQSNWQIGSSNTPSGGTAPNAFFNWASPVTNYTSSLLSNTINATSINGPVFLDYLLLFNPYSTTTLEQFKVEFKTTSSSTWTLVANYSNSVTSITNWSVTNVTLAGVTGQNFQIRFTAYGANSFSITRWSLDNIVVRATNCTTSLPTLTVTSTPTICAGSNATLSVIGGGTSYTWSPLGGNSSVTIVSPTITTTYAILSSQPGCSSSPVSAVTTVTVLNNTTSITATSSNSIVCSGTTVSLTASGASSYSWNTGSSSSTINVTPTVSTVYTVSNTNSIGCVAFKTVSINVNPNPIISVFSTNSLICPGASNNLIANGAVTYSWNTGSNSSIITVTPQTTSNYSVFGVDANGCSSTGSINVAVSPPVNIVPTATSICFGSSIGLNANSATTYTWSTGSTNASIITNPTVTTVYSVSATSAASCITSASISIVVNPNPTVTVLSTNTSVFAGTNATLSASGASTYTWNSFFTGSNIVVSPSTSTVYNVIGMSANGCTGSNNTSSINLTILPSPTVIATSSSSIVCAGSNLTLSANGATTYSWSFGSSANVVTVSPLTSSVYTVTGTNSLLCSSNATVNVNVLQSPSLSIASSTTNLCVGETATLLANGAQTYTWNTGANVNVIYVNPSANTVYTINGTGINGCIGTETIGLTVNQYPVITVNTSDSLICAGESVNLNASGAITYAWSNSMSGSSISVTPLTTTTYTVIGSNNGCNSNGTIIQKVDECTGINKYENERDLFSVFPNPNNGLVTIQVNQLRLDSHLEIYSLAGQLIISKEVNSEKFTLDLTELAAGIYYLKLINNETQGFMKIIKE